MKAGLDFSSKNLFLFDVEGVLCESIDVPKPQPFAAELILKIERLGKKVAVLTNISRRSRREVHDRLSRMGLPLRLEDVFTAGYMAAQFVRRAAGKSFVITEGGLIQDFMDCQSEISYEGPVDFVVVGADRRVTYAELNHAMKLLLAGAKLICVGSSYKFRGNFLGNEGYFLGEAALTEALRVAAGREPAYIGKPRPEIFNEVLAARCEVPAKAVMVGDSLQDDIAGAKALGIATVLVQREAPVSTNGISEASHLPDMAVTSLREILLLLP